MPGGRPSLHLTASQRRRGISAHFRSGGETCFLACLSPRRHARSVFVPGRRPILPMTLSSFCSAPRHVTVPGAPVF